MPAAALHYYTLRYISADAMPLLCLLRYYADYFTLTLPMTRQRRYYTSAIRFTRYR